MKDKDNNPFDDQVRERLEQFEMPYDPAAWSRFEQMMPGTATPPPSGLSGTAKLGLAAATVAVIAVAVYLWPSQEAATVTDILTVQETVAEQHTDAPQSEGTAVADARPDADAEQKTARPEVKAAPERSEVRSEHPQTAQDGMAEAEPPVAGPESGAFVPKKDDVAVQRPVQRPVQEDFQVKMALSRNKVCVGEELSLMAISATGGLHYEWIFGDGERSTRAEAVKTFLSPGTYDVVLTATKGESTIERRETVTVHPAPTAMFVMERPITGIPLYELSTTPQPGEQNHWEFSDGRRAAGSETRQLFRSRGTASAKLTVTNTLGCSSSREQTVRIDEEFRLFAETGFTPNGDGINDFFLPKALEVMAVPFEMTVRDASGREVFRTSDLGEPWNGREFNTGVTLPRGAYLWTVVLTEPILKNPVFSGNITIQ